MKSLISTFQLSVAVATGRLAATELAAAARPLAVLPVAALPAAQQDHKAREMVRLATHRAQMLTQRRFAIPSSAKRW